MNTIKEKITFTFAALLYLLFHLRGGTTVGEMLAGTLMQLLTTAPYCIGFTFIAVRIIQYLHHGKKIPWDRIFRIFFAIGIFFGFFFALYEYAEQGQLKSPEQTVHASVETNVASVNRKKKISERRMEGTGMRTASTPV